MHRRLATLALIALVGAIVAAACSAQKKELPTTAPPASSSAITGVGATAGAAPPAGELPPQPPAASGEFKLQDYQGQVKKTWTEGSVQYDGIVSRFSCSSDRDCTSTKFANAPAKEGDCTCAAPCTPYVVSVAEKGRREAANGRLCDNEDWYGVRCPAPDCRFIEFEKFRCYEGRCAGLAMGKAQ